MKRLTTSLVILFAMLTLIVSGQSGITSEQLDWLLKRHNDAVMYKAELANCDSVNAMLEEKDFFSNMEIEAQDSIIKNLNLALIYVREENQMLTGNNEKQAKMLINRGNIIKGQIGLIVVLILIIAL